MVVTRSSFSEILTLLNRRAVLALDTETTGLRPYHGDRLFSLIIADDVQAYYFNFQIYDDVPFEETLTRAHLQVLQKELFNDASKTWFLHNAKYDMAILFVEGLSLTGTVHCTKTQGLVSYNAHQSYSLADSLVRIGMKKDDAVEIYVHDHKLYDKISVPGKKDQVTLKYYNKVPFSIIQPYGEMDGTGTYALGTHQLEEILRKDDEFKLPPGRGLIEVVRNERKLTKTVFAMESYGVQIDTTYVTKATAYEQTRGQKAKDKFRELTGEDYAASPNLMKKVFESDIDLWEYTDKQNPSFKSEVLSGFKNPAAKVVLEIRDAKSKEDFYLGFNYHADSSGVVHPNYNPDGAKHGRFSSSAPNFQNLTNEESVDLSEEFIVRRAIIPRPGYKLLSIDFKAMEYYFSLENACNVVGYLSPLAKMVVEGHDVHQATADIAALNGFPITRSQAKTVNFLNLYGGGAQKLADGLGCSLETARKIKWAINKGVPEIKEYIENVSHAASARGFIVNWLGRRCYFPNGQASYKAPNYHISGGCADIVKVAMNTIHEFLADKKSKMVMTVHDELVFEIAEGEEHLSTDLQAIMENAYKCTYVPLKTSAAWSTKSLGDLE